MIFTSRSRLRAIVAVAAVAAIAATTARIPINQYIADTWSVLTRSNRDLAKAARDPKFPPLPDGRWPVYVASGEKLPQLSAELKREMAPGTYSDVDLRPLPADILHVDPPGLLYLPKPYVVPGGRFNEMYGWDSYFILLGLLQDGKVALARDMNENFLYEVRQYGRILNANRTYYLSRSQPPFLTRMLLEVYRADHDSSALKGALPEVMGYYRYWTSGSHLTPETGLSRYYAAGDGPAPEVVSAEKDAQGRTHYDLVRAYYRTHKVNDYEVSEFYDRANDRLTELFYKGDRSMRESGFDPSNRFGPFSVDIIHYNPVCLNSLLYIMENDIAQMLVFTGRNAESQAWSEKARLRADRVNKLMWDERDGLYYDYNFKRKEVRRYPFLTTFYPLWAGIATKEQAARVQANLDKFERPGGLQTSTFQSGNQWDAPFGWAPLEMIAVEGLRRYEYNEDADRITNKFLSLVEREYQKRGVIVEKYDVVNAGSDVSANIHFGYSSNEAGFGWTNAVFKRLSKELAHAAKQGD